MYYDEYWLYLFRHTALYCFGDLSTTAHWATAWFTYFLSLGNEIVATKKGVFLKYWTSLGKMYICCTAIQEDSFSAYFPWGWILTKAPFHWCLVGFWKLSDIHHLTRKTLQCAAELPSPEQLERKCFHSCFSHSAWILVFCTRRRSSTLMVFREFIV